MAASEISKAPKGSGLWALLVYVRFWLMAFCHGFFAELALRFWRGPLVVSVSKFRNRGQPPNVEKRTKYVSLTCQYSWMTLVVGQVTQDHRKAQLNSWNHAQTLPPFRARTEPPSWAMAKAGFREDFCKYERKIGKPKPFPVAMVCRKVRHLFWLIPLLDASKSQRNCSFFQSLCHRVKWNNPGTTPRYEDFGYFWIVLGFQLCSALLSGQVSLELNALPSCRWFGCPIAGQICIESIW